MDMSLGMKLLEEDIQRLRAVAERTIGEQDDPVKHPGHYTFGQIEVIDYIRDKMTPEEFQGFCMGNVLKYVSRHKHKNGIEDLNKAMVYLQWLIESETTNTETKAAYADDEVYTDR